MQVYLSLYVYAEFLSKNLTKAQSDMHLNQPTLCKSKSCLIIIADYFMSKMCCDTSAWDQVVFAQEIKIQETWKHSQCIFIRVKFGPIYWIVITSSPSLCLEAARKSYFQFFLRPKMARKSTTKYCLHPGLARNDLTGLFPGFLPGFGPVVITIF